MDSSYKRLGKNTILVFLGKAGSSLVSLLMLPLYTRWLTPGEYGSVDLITTYSSIILSIATCCIADAIFVIPKDSDADERIKYYSTGILFITISSLILLSLGAVGLLFKNPDASFIINNSLYVAALTISMIWLNYMQQFTRTIDKIAVFSVTGIIHAIAIAVLAFVFIPHYGLGGYILSLIFSNVISAGFSFLASKSYEYVSLQGIEKKSLNRLLKYSIPLMPNSIMWWLVNGFNKPIMESKLGLAALGLYAIAMKFPSLITALCDVFMNAFSISVIEEYRKPNFTQFFNTIFKAISFVIIIVALIVSIFSIPIIRLFASVEYIDAWMLLPTLTLSSVFSCLSSIVGGVFIARKESKYFFYSSIWGAVSSVAFTVIFIYLWGLQGCAIAVSASFFVMFLVRYFYARKDIEGFDMRHLMAQLIILIMGIIVVLSRLPAFYKIALYIVLNVLLIILNRNTLIQLGSVLKIRKQ